MTWGQALVAFPEQGVGKASGEFKESLGRGSGELRDTIVGLVRLLYLPIFHLLLVV